MCSACFAIVFLKEEKIDFTKATMARVYMATVMGCFMSLMSCRWSWYDMVGRSARIEAFLRLPERTAENLNEGATKVVGGTFGWPIPPPEQVANDANKDSAKAEK